MEMAAAKGGAKVSARNHEVIDLTPKLRAIVAFPSNSRNKLIRPERRPAPSGEVLRLSRQEILVVVVAVGIL